MTDFYYARQIPIHYTDLDDGFDQALHRIVVPSYSDKGWYRAVTSANAFRSGKQKGVPRHLAERHFDTCGWDHAKNILYSLKRSHDFDVEMRIMIESLEAVDPERGAILRNRHGAVPVIEHASLFDFYEYIGFDHKTRRYKKGR